MKYLTAAAIAVLLATAASAQTPTSTCKAQAADKKLKGAAKNSFVKKCTKDASAPAAAASAAK